MRLELDEDVAALVRPFIGERTGPGKGEFFTISAEGIARAAAHWRCAPREAMVTLLKAEVWPVRFVKNRGVLSAGEQGRLLSSRAAVIGCGGLGGHVATLLARLGIGALSLCDGDVFDESNLNRQLLARENSLGRNKAVVAAEEVRAIATHVEVREYPFAATPDNIREILDGCDVVVDCLDSLSVRLQVEAAAHALDMPFIHGSVAGEEGFAMISRPGGKSLRDIMGATENLGPSEAEQWLGVPTLTPAAIAQIEVLLAQYVLLGRKTPKQILWHLDFGGMRITPIII